MSTTLQDVCESLRTKYKHQELWLAWQEWHSPQLHTDLERQPVVTSCSGRPLAAYDGAGEAWSFLWSAGQLRFDEQSDYFRPARNKDNYLSAESIPVLKDKYCF